jgi:hypothetical protein
MSVAVMPDLVPRSRNFATQLGPGVDSMAGDTESAPDFVFVEQAHQARHPNLGAEFAARHVGRRPTIQANPQRLSVKVATKIDGYLLVCWNFNLAPYL